MEFDVEFDDIESATIITEAAQPGAGTREPVSAEVARRRLSAARGQGSERPARRGILQIGR